MYQYKVIRWDEQSSVAGQGGAAGLEAQLNNLAADGWEILSMVAQGASLIVLARQPEEARLPVHPANE